MQSFDGFSSEDLLGPLNEVERLKAPERIFIAGDASLLRTVTRVSIVGSRKASEEGLRRASKLARILKNEGIVVVSGLAQGIDTAAHRTAIAEGGRTIAVLGTPLDEVFPRQNAELQHLIMKEHLAISQFPVGHPVLRTNFPQRNRTMALISDASVIVEAGDTSGSLSQGYEALRLGRPLFIMKSILDTPGLKWPQEMCRYGAQILASPEDIIDFLPSDIGGTLAGATF